MISDEDNWQTVSKPKKIKSGEIKAVIDEEENSKLIVSMSIKSSMGIKKDVTSAKKTQIPVKIKAQPEKPIKKKSESPPGFKTLQAALASLNLKEMTDELERTKIQFNNNDVIMLKSALTFINDKIRLEKVDDSLFFDKPLGYPNSILPEGLKAIIHPLIKKCSSEILNYFFHNLLQSVCEALNKSKRFVGHLILLEQIALHLPEVCLANLASTVILRNSYQNQPSICLSLFWALGSAGLRDTTVGLKVWVEIMSSVLNVKSYTKFVIDYFHKILAVSDKTPPLDITSTEYETVVELLMANDAKVKSKDLQKLKMKCVELLNEKYVSSSSREKIDSVFTSLLNLLKQHPQLCVKAILKSAQLFPEECLNVWRKNFDKFSRQNIFIFNYLQNNLKNFEELVETREFVSFIKEINYEVHPSLMFVKDIPAKMAENKKQKKQKGDSSKSCSGACCKWIFGSFLLFGAIAGLISYDTNVLHGGKFEESSVGRVLKQTGALPHVENAWFVSLKYGAKGYKWAELNVPPTYVKVKTYLEPHCDFAKDLGLTLVNSAKKLWEGTKVYVAEKTPVVIAFIDKYSPGLGQKIHDGIVNIFSGICNFLCSTWKHSVDFFKTKIFIGHLSPESLGKAFNSTTQRALGYYSWFHEKVDFYAKIN